MTQETEKKQEKTIRERVKAILEIWPEPISLRSRTPLAVEKKEGRAILYPGEFVLASSKEAGGTGMSEKSVFLWKREINMTNKGKPFIKWVGGKTQLIDSIENTLPKDFETRQDLTYIEPFVGGGAILFWILQKYPNIKKAVINDINPDLTTAYKTIKTKPKELVMKLRSIADEYLPLSEEKRKEYYLAKRDRFNTKFLLEPVENSALFIFLNRTCFNGLYRVNSRGLFNVPFGKYANPKICDEQTILADSELLQKVEILTGDFEETLKYATANSFFYFDPPYKPLSETSSFNSYAKEEFNDKEQIRLGSFCQRIDLLGHDFILSNSDVKGKNPDDNFFDDLYSQFEINRVFATRMVNADAEKRGKLTELLITNQQSKFR